MLSSSVVRNKFPPYIFVVGYLIVCLWGGVFCFRDGISRLYSNLAVEEDNLEYAQRAVGLTPSDPNAHIAHAKVLIKLGELTKGGEDLVRATALRPADYFLWLELGHLQSSTDDLQGALVSLRMSAALAPFYAQPRWYLGYTLLQVSRFDEGFRELRLAAASNPALYPDLLDLASQVYGGDAAETERVAYPRNTSERLALARFLIKQGAIEEAVELLGAGELTEADRQPLIQELVTAKHFYAAYTVRAFGRGGALVHSPEPFGQVENGGFESDKLDGSGLDWRMGQNRETLNVSFDNNEPRSGAKSLRISFEGKSDPDVPIISQIVLVEPATKYKLVFSTRTKDIVTGGLPVVVITDLSSADKRELCRGQQIPGGTSGWQDRALSFVTPEGAEAISISLQRQHCSDSSCPIFGKLWLDALSLSRM